MPAETKKYLHPDISIGKGCIIDPSARFITINAKIGDFCVIGPQTTIESCTIEDGVIMRPGSQVLKGAYIGESSLINLGGKVLANTRIGKNCHVGINVIQNHDLEDNSTNLRHRASQYQATTQNTSKS